MKRIRKVFMDSRAGRVLREDRRSIFDEKEWGWIVEHASGDFDHAYLAEMAFRPETKMSSAVYQAVCSPYRNPLDSHERLAIKIGFTPPFVAAMRALGRSAGVPDPGLRWRLAEGPYFDNQVATRVLTAAKRRCSWTRRSPATRRSGRWTACSSAVWPSA